MGAGERLQLQEIDIAAAGIALQETATNCSRIAAPPSTHGCGDESGPRLAEFMADLCAAAAELRKSAEVKQQELDTVKQEFEQADAALAGKAEHTGGRAGG